MAVLHSAPRFTQIDGLKATLTQALGDHLVEADEEHGELLFTVKRDSIEDALRILRDDHGYQQLMEIAGVDYPSRPERFEVVYMLLSLTKNSRIMVKVSAAEATPVPTVTMMGSAHASFERSRGSHVSLSEHLASASTLVPVNERAVSSAGKSAKP